MKKIIMTAIISSIVLESAVNMMSVNTLAAGSPYGPGYQGTVADSMENSLANYMTGYFQVTSRPDLDAKMLDFIHTFEQNKNSSTSVIVANGTLSECEQLRDYFNYNFCFTSGFRVECQKSSVGSYFVAFPNTLNADQKIADYKQQAEKQKEIAAALRGASNDETIVNIQRWLNENLNYDYDSLFSQAQTPYESYYVNYMDLTKPVLCKGYSSAFYYMCSINGIWSDTVTGIYNGTNHTWNRVSRSDGVVYADSLRKTDAFSPTLWSGYTIN